MAERELIVLDYDDAGNPIWGCADETALSAMFHDETEEVADGPH